jgi:zinc protease
MSRSPLSRIALALTVAGLPSLAMAADDVPRAKMELNMKPYAVNQVDFVLPSGLRVVFQEDHSQPLVSITSVTDRGSAADPAGREGIAHVVEHLWFRSRHKDDKGNVLPKVWDLLEEMGANLNAFTADDQTVYMTVAPASNLVNLLRLEGLRMRSAVEGVGADVLQIEREVVRNELRMRYENDAGAVFGHLLVKLFPKTHPYGRAAFAGIGNNDSLNAITIEDVRQFVKDNYGPDKTTIFIVGDFDSAKANDYLAEIGRDLMVDPKNPKADITLMQPKARVTGPAAEPPPPVEPAEVKGKVTVTKVKGPVEGPLVALAWSVPAGWRDHDVLMQVAANQMTPAIYSELDTAWTAGAPITGIGCGLQGALEGSSVICTIELEPGQDGQKVADKALDGLYKQWTTAEDELSRKFSSYLFSYGKLQTMAFTLQQVDLISSLFSDRVTSAAMFAHYTGDLQYYSRTFKSIGDVQPQAVQEFAKKYLTRQRAVAVVMEPYEDGDVKTDSSDAQYRGARREDAVESIIPTETLTPDFIAKTVITPDKTKIVEKTLDNGMRLIVMPYTSGPLVQTRLIFGGGTASMPGGEAVFADAMSRNDSYGYLDSLRLAGFDGMGMESLHTEMSFSGSAGNFNDALYVLRERIEKLMPDTNGRIDWIDSRKGNVMDWMGKPDGWAPRVAMERLMPNHPLSDWYDHAELATMGKWNATVSEKAWRTILQPENATLVVVGNVTPEEVDASVATYFASWKGWHREKGVEPKPTTTYPAPTAPPNRTVLVFHKKNSSQTNVSYQCQLTPATPELVPASQVLGSVLSEGAWLALREQTGASYGAYAYTYDQPGGAHFLGMSSLVQNDASGLAVKAMLGLGEDAKAGKMDPKLVALRKFATAQEYVLGQQSTSQMADRLTGVLKKGMGFDWFDRYPKLLGTVTIDKMTPLLERCVGHEVVTLVGPKDVITAKLDAEKIPYEVFDWEKARVEYGYKHEIKSIIKAEEKRKKEEAKKPAETK